MACEHRLSSRRPERTGSSCSRWRLRGKWRHVHTPFLAAVAQGRRSRCDEQCFGCAGLDQAQSSGDAPSSTSHLKRYCQLTGWIEQVVSRRDLQRHHGAPPMFTMEGRRREGAFGTGCLEISPTRAWEKAPWAVISTLRRSG